ncbi:CPBP family intramembrane glutamic endopeptidase [Protaetiibacter larvae]|uniref:CPBP family intramembrane metalloprotease n=1 Tax=Protaetiibacter larvae TaxID=2592654 RepID=A0A5C1Y9D7_9MICO|nr:CPBP family intramembrane glutamic endopeptidase [Protaetiibacter larvae]QEO09522.1 CPBP family intramembrane metalloprotease [Protaetiibacter larvae]
MSDVERHARSRKSHYRDPLSALTVAAVAYLACLLLALVVVPRIGVLGLPSWIDQLLTFVLIWLPLLIAVYAAGRRYGTGSARTDTGLRLRVIDLGIGLLAGLVLRLLAEWIAPSSTGAPALDGTTAPALPPVPELLVLVVGGVLVAPLVEELFFRGLLQRSASGLVRGGRSARIIVAVLVSTPLFVLLHLALAAPANWGGVAVVTGISGLGFGLLAAITRRLGAAILAHGVFNALGLAILYLR